ncbi:hypothetical protein GCM10023080_022830 [Streptomyces pseudoechinosporeus]
MDLEDAGFTAKFLIRDRDGKFPEVGRRHRVPMSRRCAARWCARLHGAEPDIARRRGGAHQERFDSGDSIQNGATITNASYDPLPSSRGSREKDSASGLYNDVNR